MPPKTYRQPNIDKTLPDRSWVRLIGTHGKQEGDSRGIYGSGPKFGYNFYTLQGGADLLRHEYPGGDHDHLGLMFAIGAGNSTVTHFDGTSGTDRLNAYSLGGYWTHFGSTGWSTQFYKVPITMPAPMPIVDFRISTHMVLV